MPASPALYSRKAACPIHGAATEAFDSTDRIPISDRLWSWMDCGHYYSPKLGWRTAELRPL